MRLMTLTLALFLLSITFHSITGQPPDRSHRPLDLPSGGGSSDEDSEDHPELIHFFGEEYEGDAFFWCLDRSGLTKFIKCPPSNHCNPSPSPPCGEILLPESLESIYELQEEFSLALSSLSSSAEFGVVVFSNEVLAWREIPMQADSLNKLSAINWVTGVMWGLESCIGPAMLKTINLANQSNRQLKQIFLYADREPYCDGDRKGEESLKQITQANWKSIPIHTIYRFPDVQLEDDDGYRFMEQLAVSNKGTFRIQW